MTSENEMENTSEKKGPQGVGGWLLLFVIGNFVSFAMNAFYLLHGEEMSWGNRIMVFHPPQLVMLAFFSLATAIALLATRNRGAVRLAQVALAAYLVSTVILFLAGGLRAPAGYRLEEGAALEGILRAFLVNLVWQIYLVRSKRVKATYRPLQEVESAAAFDPGRSLTSLFSRKEFGINYLFGGGVLLAWIFAENFWRLYWLLLNKSHIQLPIFSEFFLSIVIPAVLFAFLIIVLLHSLQKDWLAVVLLGVSGMLSVLVYQIMVHPLRGTEQYYSFFIYVRYGIDLLRVFLEFFFLACGMVIAVRAKGLRYWSFIFWAVAWQMTALLFNSFLFSVVHQSSKSGFDSFPLKLIICFAWGTFLYLGLALHLKKAAVFYQR